MVRDPWRCEGQVALITGAGRGLGRACALELAAAGATVVCVARTASEVEATAAEAGDGAMAIAADMTDELQVQNAVNRAAELGELRILITAAGTNRPGPAATYPLADWDLLFALNVRATFLACQSVGRNLLDRSTSGAIVMMSSQMGSVGYPGRAAYCATKHAIDGLTRALAVEWAKAGIRVNAVAPTFVMTPMTEQMFLDESFRTEILERLPTGRLASAVDVARATRYLACEASSNVTGHILRVDGGWTAW